MLLADMNVRAVNPALKLRPIAFNAIGPGNVVRGELARVVAHRHVIEAEIVKAAIAAKFIRRNGRTGVHVELDHCFHRCAMTARDDLGNHLAARFFMPTTTALLPL